MSDPLKCGPHVNYVSWYTENVVCLALLISLVGMMKLYSAQPAQPHMVALLDKYGCFLESGGGRKKEKESGICGLAPRPA